MYRSLEKECVDFHLYIFAFDDHCYALLSRLNLKHATIISLHNFEDGALLAVKSSRTTAEYCWTCTPSSIAYCIQKYSLDHCTYIDADLYFFSDPKVLIDEMGEKSVLITDHRYTPEYDQTVLSGKYCVQFITFKSNEEGMRALYWWRDACLDWCYNRPDGERFGDQKYLDDWTSRFKGVHELSHLGGGVAPWNVQQYSFSNTGNKMEGSVNTTGQKFDLIFYHFHDFQYISRNVFKMSGHTYRLQKAIVHKIYKPYIKALSSAAKEIKRLDVQIQPNEFTGDFKWLKKAFGRYMLFLLRGYYKNYYHKRGLLYGQFN